MLYEDIEQFNETVNLFSLNPYSNGICSTSDAIMRAYQQNSVLILILMEYALRVVHRKCSFQRKSVLILILMEYALRVCKSNSMISILFGLNPYSNGICSTSAILHVFTKEYSAS